MTCQTYSGDVTVSRTVSDQQCVLGHQGRQEEGCEWTHGGRLLDAGQEGILSHTDMICPLLCYYPNRQYSRHVRHLLAKNKTTVAGIKLQLQVVFVTSFDMFMMSLQYVCDVIAICL